MPYKVTITKTEQQEVEPEQDWTAIEKRPLTEKEAQEVSVAARSQQKTIYGYTPKRVTSETVTVEIYKQVVPELDLPAIIKAVNMME